MFLIGKLIGVLFLCFVFLSCSSTRKNELVEKRIWESKMISRGDNYPSIDVSDYSELFYLLHKRVPFEKIEARLGIDHNELSKQIGVLQKEGLVKSHGNYFLPSIMILTLEDGEKFYQQLQLHSTHVAKLIQSKVSKVKFQVKKLKPFSNQSYEDISFFLLSNVLLDDIQIDFVESDFLKQKRTERAGKNYYQSLQEKTAWQKKEAFHIYGNQCKFMKVVAYCLYGNHRNQPHLLNVDTKEILRDFPELDKQDPKLDLLQKFLKKDKRVYPKIQKLKKYHLNQKTLVLSFGEGEYKDLDKIANIITDDLISYLSQIKSELHKDYKQSKYLDEVTFEEYFIWWYHFLYTDVTNKLEDLGLLKVPESGVYIYLITK